MKKREHLFSLRAGKELLFDYFSGTGPGGQNRNKKQKCVRLTHPDSGVTVRATEERSKSQNERVALHRLVENKRFNAWVRVHSAMIIQGFKDLEDKVNKMLNNNTQTKIEYITSFTCDKCGSKAKTISETNVPKFPKGWISIGTDNHLCSQCKKESKCGTCSWWEDMNGKCWFEVPNMHEDKPACIEYKNKDDTKEGSR